MAFLRNPQSIADSFQRMCRLQFSGSLWWTEPRACRRVNPARVESACGGCQGMREQIQRVAPAVGTQSLEEFNSGVERARSPELRIMAGQW